MENILLDANILQYGANNNHSAEVTKLIRSLASEGAVMFITNYTSFEAYRGLAYRRINSMKTFIDTFVPADVDVTVFKIAAALYTCYRRHEATKLYIDRYSDGDIVLAASAFRYNAGILTANANDFPRPFFKEIKNLQIQSTNKQAPIFISLLQPDAACFNNALKNSFN